MTTVKELKDRALANFNNVFKLEYVKASDIRDYLTYNIFSFNNTVKRDLSASGNSKLFWEKVDQWVDKAAYDKQHQQKIDDMCCDDAEELTEAQIHTANVYARTTTYDMTERQQTTLGDMLEGVESKQSETALIKVFAKIAFVQEYGMQPDFENATEYFDSDLGATNHHFYCDVLIGHAGNCCDIREDLRAYYIAANYSDETQSNYWFSFWAAYRTALLDMKANKPQKPVKKPVANSFNQIYLLTVPRFSTLRAVGFGQAISKAA